MPPSLASARASCQPPLLGSLFAFVAAAIAAAQAAPDNPVPAAIAAFAPWAGALLVNEAHKLYSESNAHEKAQRNHLIRRGMAQALSKALRHFESDCDDIPDDLREDFFTHWPELLAQAQTDDSLVDRLFPLSSSEDQWNLLNRYFDDLVQARQAKLSEEKLTILSELESQDRNALASLLRDFPVQPAAGRILNLLSLADRWPQDQALAFAHKLLPQYRIAFAMLVSEDEPLQQAIAFKAQKFTRAQLEDLQCQLEDAFTRLSNQITGVSGQVAGVSTKIDRLDAGLDARFENLEKLLQKAIAAGQMPANAITPQNREARVEETAREIPKVVEEIRQSSSPVASLKVEELLAAGKLEEAAKLGQTRLDSAQRDFAQAQYDMGRINEISFRWTDALENFRQAWEISNHTNAEFGFKLGEFAASLNQHWQAIAAYEQVLPHYPDPANRATTLNRLGILYTNTQRHAQAEESYKEALTLYRKLAAANPAAYEPDVAMTLNNLGALYYATQRHAQAE